MQNERHNDRFFVEFTFFDIISNMKTEYDRLCKIQARVVAQDFVNQYCGYSVTTKKISTLLQTANTVMRLPSSVIKVIGEISNEEHPEWVLSYPRLNKSKATSLTDVLSKEDCRVFRNFIHITSLKSAKSFMNAKHQEGERAQRITLYRLRDIYKERSFSKPIQPEEVSRQYELSVFSIEQEIKFIQFIKPDPWPEEMSTIRENLLNTVQLSDEVQSNRGNDDILPSLLRSYKRNFPVKFAFKQQIYERS